MAILNRAPPNRTRFYVESANAKALTIRKLGHFTAHIYCLQIKAGMFCRTFQLERLWLRVRSIPGEPFLAVAVGFLRRSVSRGSIQ